MRQLSLSLASDYIGSLVLTLFLSIPPLHARELLLKEGLMRKLHPLSATAIATEVLCCSINPHWSAAALRRPLYQPVKSKVSLKLSASITELLYSPKPPFC